MIREGGEGRREGEVRGRKGEEKGEKRGRMGGEGRRGREDGR